MRLLTETPGMERYLELQDVVDFNEPRVMRLADRLSADNDGDAKKVESVFHYLQENIPHTFDIGRREIACKASDVLRLGHGICYAKANLAAALLRSMGIPAGFCYQKFRMEGTPGSKFVLHCLNGVYYEDIKRWVRIDVRTPDEGFDPRFKPYEDSGIYPIDPSMGEEEYPYIHVRPYPPTIEALMASTDAVLLHDSLPQDILR